MPIINVKFAYGDKVNCGGVEGMVTAIFVRDKRTAYEFSYISKSGDPKRTNVEEIELEASKLNSIGFKKAPLL